MASYTFLVTLPSGSDIQRGRTTCSRKVDHTGGCMFNSIMSRIRNCSGNGFTWQHNCVWSRDWNWFLRNVAPIYVCKTFLINLRSTNYGNQFSDATGCWTPGSLRFVMTQNEILSNPIDRYAYDTKKIPFATAQDPCSSFLVVSWFQYRARRCTL